MHELVVLMPLSLDVAGPVVFSWGGDGKGSAPDAERLFVEEVNRGGIALQVLGKEKARLMPIFDPAAEKILILPPTIGG